MIAFNSSAPRGPLPLPLDTPLGPTIIIQ